MFMGRGEAMDVTELDRRFRLYLVGATVLFGLVRAVLPEENPWVHAIFIILMAGNVGYFTNFLAIRMLFQPKQGKVLGWEGLVPKNKPQIAASLAESVQTRLLSPDIILEYIRENNLIEAGTQRLGDWADRILNDERVREKITSQLVELLKTHGDEVMEVLFASAHSMLKKLAADPEQVRAHWTALRERLSDYLNDRANRERVTGWLRVLVLEEIPRLASLIDQALVDFLKERDTMGSIGMGLKRVFSFDEDAIRSALERFVSDPESAELLVRVMDSVAEDLIEKLNSEATQQHIITRVEDWVDAANEYAREHLLPMSAERLRDYLHDEASWEQIDGLVIKGIGSLKNSLNELLATDKGTTFIKGQLEAAVQRLNVSDLVEEQVMKLDTDELEDLILNNTGGNLVMIQILGGVLGLIAGTVQVDIRFSLPLAAMLGVVYIAFAMNRRKYSKLD